MIHSIDIGDFRVFKDNHIKLGRKLTAIAGKNGVGKSTLLAMLGNTCALRKQKSLLNTPFETKFNEIFKGDIKFDTSGYKYKVNFSNRDNPNEIIETKHNRVSWLENKTRFRMIPETKETDKKNSKKYEMPVLYLGLSRLYPLGESKEFSKKKLSLDDSIKNDFILAYKEILSLDGLDEYSLDSIKINDAPRKKGIGINSSRYSSILNSAGQDNLGQILLAVLSFKVLKENFEDYKEGLLLIDELDATLHHYAQMKLINFLLKMSKKLNLQIVFTTHSENILRYLYSKSEHNKDDVINEIETVYINKFKDTVKIQQSPCFYKIKSDLFLSDPTIIPEKINVIFEDKEALWFFEKLIEGFEFSMFLNNINLDLGCEQLLRLIKNNSSIFYEDLFILDGDVEDVKLNINTNIKHLKLPGGASPEEVLYKYLSTLDESHDFWLKCYQLGISKESLLANGPFSSKYSNYNKDREKYKSWFNDNRKLFNSLSVVNFWIKDNKTEHETFLAKFKEEVSVLFKKNLFLTID